MKKAAKISLITLGVLLGLGIAVFVGADVWVSRYVKKQVDKALGDLPFGEASVGDIQIRLFSGTAEVRDIAFSYGPALEAHVDKVEVGRIFYSALLDHRIYITDVHVVRPSLELVYDSKHPDELFPKVETGDMSKVSEYLSSAELDRLKIRNARLMLQDIATGNEISIDSATVRLYDLGYTFQDSTFHYNDSLYRIEVGSFGCYVPQEPIRIEAHQVNTRDGGPLTTGNVRIKHACDKRKLASIKHEQATWIDLRVNSVRTSSLNLFHKALNQDLNLDTIAVEISHMDIFRDARMEPKKPFPMPQTVLTQLPVTLEVKHVDARVKQIDIEFASTDINKGEMHLKDIRAAVEHATNRRGSTIFVHGQCPMDKGLAKAEMSIVLNRACDWKTKLHAENINTNYLNSFIRPLVGMTFACHVDTLDAQYSGNSVNSTGTFRMLYHGLDVKVYKEDNIPYKVITKNADAITQLGNTLIPKSNPTAVDIRPRAYNVEWKRDEWSPFPLYMFGCCIDGAKKTMLPGLYVHKQVQQKPKTAGVKPLGTKTSGTTKPAGTKKTATPTTTGKKKNK